MQHVTPQGMNLVSQVALKIGAIEDGTHFQRIKRISPAPNYGCMATGAWRRSLKKSSSVDMTIRDCPAAKPSR